MIIRTQQYSRTESTKQILSRFIIWQQTQPNELQNKVKQDCTNYAYQIFSQITVKSNETMILSLLNLMNFSRASKTYQNRNVTENMTKIFSKQIRNLQN